jgi:hypothetical protein
MKAIIDYGPFPPEERSEDVDRTADGWKFETHWQTLTSFHSDTPGSSSLLQVSINSEAFREA